MAESVSLSLDNNLLMLEASVLGQRPFSDSALSVRCWESNQNCPRAMRFIALPAASYFT